MRAGERWGFSVAGFGQNLTLNFVNLFLLTYLYTGVGLSSRGIATVSVVLGVAKIWDAVNDLVMGVIVDRTSTRWGRFRPYLLFTALPIAALTTAMFWLPTDNETRAIIIFGICYVLWDAVYTLSDVPYWALTTVITTDDRSRTKLIAMARTAGMLALAVMTLTGTQIATACSGGAPEPTAAGWSWTALLVSVIGMGLFTLGFFTTTEKLPATAEDRPSLRQTLRELAGNRPLFAVLASTALGFGRAVIQVGGAVVAVVVFGDAGMFTILGAGLIVGILVATLASPLLLARFTRRTVMIANGLISAAAYLVIFLVGYQSLPVVIVCMVVCGLMIGVYTVTVTAMIGDTAAWAEIRTGRRSEGIAFAGLTFASKLMNALATMAFGAIISIIGYQADAPVTDAMRDAVWASISLLPAVSALLSVVPLLGYRLPERELAARLAASRAERDAGLSEPGSAETS